MKPSYLFTSKPNSVSHHLPSVGPKQLCALAHLGCTYESGYFLVSYKTIVYLIQMMIPSKNFQSKLTLMRTSLPMIPLPMIPMLKKMTPKLETTKRKTMLVHFVHSIPYVKVK